MHLHTNFTLSLFYIFFESLVQLFLFQQIHTVFKTLSFLIKIVSKAYFDLTEIITDNNGIKFGLKIAQEFFARL
jgi:hypothetical protein